MPVYTVHEPPPRTDDPLAQAEGFAFVRDGFSFWAFLFAPLWLVRYRLWLVLLGYIVVVAAIIGALRYAEIPAWGWVLVALVFAILFGFEANTLRRWTLTRRGWTTLAVVVGLDRESAERRFFDVWVGGDTARESLERGWRGRKTPLKSSDVVGLFPEPGGRT
jgi:hypothetical protein